MDGADRAPLRFHDCFVDRPCRCCVVSDLGFLVDALAGSDTNAIYSFGSFFDPRQKPDSVSIS